MSLVSILCLILATIATTRAHAITKAGSPASDLAPLSSGQPKFLRTLTLHDDKATMRSLQGGYLLPEKVTLNLNDATVYVGNGISGSASAATIVDGDVTISSATPTGSQTTCADDEELSVTVDLGGIYQVSDIILWHNWENGPIQHCAQKIQLSIDDFTTNSSITVFETGASNYGPLEVEEGNMHSFSPVYARYIRHQSGRSNASEEVAFVETEIVVQPNDFKWDLAAGDRFVNVTHDSITNDATIRFLFYVGDSRPVYKEFRTTLLNSDCVTPATAPHALTVSYNDSHLGNLFVTVDIDQSSLSGSSYWSSPSGASGQIDFCLLVEYVYVNPSDPDEVVLMNFLQTAVALDVDLSASFAIAGVRTQLDSHDIWTAVEYDYQVQAQFCDNEDPDREYSQGSTVSICITTAPNVPEFVGLNRIEELAMKQEGDGSIAVTLISDSEDSLLTQTTCTDVVCRIDIQMPAVFFVADPLRDLDVTGIAVLSLGDDENEITTRRLEERGENERLPETSTGFTAKVHIIYDHEEEEDISSGTAHGFGGGFRIISSILWTMASVVGLSCVPWIENDMFFSLILFALVL